jgi:PAS domain S-box-containing protein
VPEATSTPTVRHSDSGAPARAADLLQLTWNQLWPAHSRVLIGAVLAGLLVGVLLYPWAVHRNRAIAQVSVDDQGRAISQLLMTRMEWYARGTRGVRGAIVVAGSDFINPEMFSAYAATLDMEREFPGALGFGFARRVVPGDDANFVRSARRNIAPEFAIVDLSPRVAEPAGQDRYVVELIEPLARNRRGLGVDIMSEPVRRAAVVQAIRTGKEVLTGPISILRNMELPQTGVAIVLPVYHPRLALGTAEMRDAATVGIVYLPLLVEDLADQLRHSYPALHIRIDDRTGGDSQPLLSVGDTSGLLDSTVQASLPLALFGRDWVINVRPTAAMADSLGIISPIAVALYGTVACVILGLLLAIGVALRRNQRDLLDQQGLFAFVIEQSADAVVTVTRDGTIRSWNQEATRKFGHQAQHAIGRNISQLLATDDLLQEDIELRERCASGQRVDNHETVRVTQDGTHLDVAITLLPLMQDHRGASELAVVIRDIRSQKAHERELQDANAMLSARADARTLQLETARRTLQNVLDALPSRIAYWDHSLVIRFANRACRLANGIALDKTGDAPLRVLQLHQDPVYGAERPQIEAALQGSPQVVERTSCAARGETLHQEVHYIPDVVNGAVVGLYVVEHDISALAQARQQAAELREAQQAQHEHERFLERTCQIARVGGYRIDLVSGEQLWSRETCRIHDTDEDTLITHEYLISMLDPSERINGLRAVKQAIDSGRNFDRVVHIHTPLGRDAWVHYRAEVELENGRPVALRGAVQDVTARHVHEQQLRNAIAQAQQTSASKSEFLANMSHELRAPLQEVADLTALLRQPAPAARERDEMLSRLHQTTASLLGFVNNVLDLSDMDAGHLLLDERALSMSQLLQEARQMLAATAQDQGITLSIQADAQLPAELLGDPARLRQILLNLARAGILRSPQGQVELGSTAIERGAHHALVRISVRDSGASLSTDALTTLFDPFAHSGDSTQSPGTASGLDLSISRRLAELMGGQIGARNIEGGGCEFWADVSLRVPRTSGADLRKTG